MMMQAQHTTQPFKPTPRPAHMPAPSKKRPAAPKPIVTYQPMRQTHRYVTANSRIDACAKNFVIISGHVQIIRNNEVIQDLRAGEFLDCFPMSAFRDQERIVFAKTGCFLAELSDEQMDKLQSYPPEIVVRIVTTL